MTRTLSARESAFVDAYFETKFNATQAALKAGYKKAGARVQATRLLTRANVQKAIKARQRQLTDTSKIEKERIIAEIARLAFVDPGKLFDTHGNPIEIPDLDEDTRRAIAGFEFYEECIRTKDGKGDEGKMAVGYTKKIKWADKLPALKLLAQMLGHYVDKKELSGTMTLEELVLGSMEIKEEEKRIQLRR